jgi:hypothetical protein
MFNIEYWLASLIRPIPGAEGGRRKRWRRPREAQGGGIRGAVGRASGRRTDRKTVNDMELQPRLF